MGDVVKIPTRDLVVIRDQQKTLSAGVLELTRRCTRIENELKAERRANLIRWVAFIVGLSLLSAWRHFS